MTRDELRASMTTATPAPARDLESLAISLPVDLSVLGIGPKCVYCGKPHEISCDQIKAVEYRTDGSVKVELMTPNDYPDPITWPNGELEIKFYEGR